MDIEALIKHGESETLEFKESTGEWKEIIETISAFSNIHGGTIIISVSKSGLSLGIEIGKGTIECLANQISHDPCFGVPMPKHGSGAPDPKIHPRITVGKIKGKSLVVTYIALARYKGKEVGVERLDYKEFNGHLFQQIDGCDEYIKGHIAVMSKLLPYRIEREDIPEYSLFSVRGLITNAMCIQ